MPRTGRRIVRTLIGLAALCAIGIGYQQWGEARDSRQYPRPGEMVSIGDHRLHMWCIGQGSPGVFLISGSGTPSVTLYDAQLRIARFTRVCSYDRAGLGWSDPPARAMALPDLVDDFDALVTHSGMQGPIIVVPESFGGMIALGWFARNPQRFGGGVFVDASEPQLWLTVAPKTLSASRRKNILWQAGWRLGIIRAFYSFGEPAWAARLPVPLHGRFRAVFTRPIPSFSRDWTDVVEQTRPADVPAAEPGMLSNRPIIVLRHGHSSPEISHEFESGWPAAQDRIAGLSRNSQMIVATANGHPIAEENPQLVADSVQRIVGNLRGLATLSRANPRSRPTTQ